jgi:peptidyl-prolyl cis-trans isomerase SurA
MKYVLILLLSLCIESLPAQTLFTYGPYQVDAKEFLRAYNKNNTKPVLDKAAAMREYLDLYIKSKLKIQEAFNLHMDTLPQIKTEVGNLRSQISEGYMTDPLFAERLQKEAFQRSQKDIHVAHIFISFRNAQGFVDTVAAQQKRDEILERLKKGEDFLKTARQYSDDTSARQNNGDIGYITVFTLPYQFESAIYKTPPGKYTDAIQSRIGYHLFKNLDERKAIGKIKAQQILLAFPPGAAADVKNKTALLADSIYKRILAGDNFSRLALQFSNDYISANVGGQMEDISVGQYDPAFEKMVWSLPKDGAVSKPFQTAYGWHIVKRVSLKPVVTDENDKSNQQELKMKITADNRWKLSAEYVNKQVYEKAGFKKFSYSDAALWNMSDSVIDHKPMKEGWAIKDTTRLFAIGDSIYDAHKYINYAYLYRYKQDGTGPKPWEQVRDEWVQASIRNYYRDHLEFFNENFRNQMNEFRDGNMFFEIMQEQVWNKAQNDSAMLQTLYDKNKQHYLWKHSALAVVFYCQDPGTANEAYNLLKKNPAAWRKVAEAYTEKLVADSARYEWEQLPNADKIKAVAGAISAPLVNKADNTASFCYILQIFPDNAQRSFTEARGLVINDYQGFLEDEWNKALLKKYPIVIDENVFKQIAGK